MRVRWRVPVLIGGGVAAAYPLVRHDVLNWGATPAEAAATLPGDELLPDADGMSTRAIEIAARPRSVWPWLAQMGPSPRGGAYTYDWIENLLGLGMHSVDRVLPEFQHPQVGDTIGFGANVMRLARVEPERVLAWRSEDGNWVWTFVLSVDGGTTRLISRNRFRLPSLGARAAMLPMEPGSLIMERKMLLGIKRRAETLVGSAWDEPLDVVEFGEMTDAYRAQLEGDEIDPFDASGDALTWRGKDRHVGLRDAHGRLVASTGLLTTEVRVGEDTVIPIVGIGGVIVEAGHRGRGLAREVLGAALVRAQTLGPALALLFCHHNRAGLYEKLGFSEVARPVTIEQPGGPAEMPLMTMWRGLSPGAELPDGPVTLLDLPF